MPALTVVWHPDPSRVGDMVLLAELTKGGVVAISRQAPLFAAPGDETLRGLEDRHLSRTAASVEVVATGKGGQIELRPGSVEVPTEIDGVPLERSVVLGTSDLDRGVVLMLARRIVLCIHRAGHPVVRGPRMGLVGRGDAMEEVREAIARVADIDVPLLIRGETGTGKELVARAVVQASRRADRPCVTVNMAAIPASTAAAELFGHERGAFTGATLGRSGYFGAANGGTLFLDEVGATPTDVQAMLLRTLESGEVLPLGAGRARKVDVRIMAATDADLETGMAARSFSQPLFQRLAGFQILLPPLRTRREDIGTLLLHFLREELAVTNELHRLEPPDGDAKAWLSASQVARLAMGTWPGNVRALRNAARQIVISSRGRPRAFVDEIVDRLAQRPESEPRRPSEARPAAPAAASAPRERAPWEIGPDALLEALRSQKWSPSATAAALNIPRATLYELMDRHPGIRKANAIPRAELRRCYDECSGDLDLMAERLQVSTHGLKMRLAQSRREGW